MPIFLYTAKDTSGKTVKGQVEVMDEFHLRSALRSRNLYLLEAKQERGKYFREKGKLTKRELIIFTVHLATSLESGIPIITAIQDFSEEIERKRFIFDSLVTMINSGMSFSAALERYPRSFPEIYINIVRAGEATGNLDKVLWDLVRFMEWQEDVARQVKQASIYPTIVILLVIGVITLLMTVTLPRIVPILKSYNVELPWVTRLFISLSNWFQAYWWSIPLVIVLFILFYRFTYKHTKAGRNFWDTGKLKIPIFGALHRKIAFSRFSHYMATLYKAGIGLLQSLSIVEDVVGNSIIGEAISRVRERVMAGEKISEAMKSEEIFPKLVIRMMAVGEETGRVSVTLEKVSEYYDREVPAAIKRFFAFLEPAIIIFLGIVVVLLALAIFLPIYKLASAIGAQAR